MAQHEEIAKSAERQCTVLKTTQLLKMHFSHSILHLLVFSPQTRLL